MSAGRSNADLPFPEWIRPRGSRGVADGAGMVQGASSSTDDGLLVERERVSVGESHAERLSLSLLSVAFPDSIKTPLRSYSIEKTDNLPNMSLRACIFGLLAEDGVLLSSAKSHGNREGAAKPKSVRQTLKFRISTE